MKYINNYIVCVYRICISNYVMTKINNTYVIIYVVIHKYINSVYIMLSYILFINVIH